MGNNINNFCSTCNNKEENIEQDYSNNANNKVKANNPMFNSFGPQDQTTKPTIEILNYGDSSVYTGEVINSKRNGIGIFHTPKQFYEGEFINDLYDGFGYLETIKKICYLGEFKNDNKSGTGVQFSLVDSYIYEGEWLNNHKNGIGKEILPDNSEFEGEFLDGKKHGIGIYKMSNGRKYEGEFKHNKIHGYGLLICDNGDYYNGFWEDNEYNGFGVLAKKNSLFKGFFRKDKKNGYGIKYTLNSEENKTNLILVGNWVENSLEKLALGINSDTYKVMCIYMFVNNKLKSTTQDENVIKEKTVNNKECTNLLNFYLEYKDRE